MKIAIGVPLKMKMTYVEFSFNLVKWISYSSHYKFRYKYNIKNRADLFFDIENLFLASKVQNKKGLSTYLFNCPYAFAYFVKVNDPYHRLKKSIFCQSSPKIYFRALMIVNIT